jgi:phage shock protein C
VTTEKKLYRAHGTIGGGVCTGVAEYLKVDPIVIQIITVFLTILSAGVLAVAYVALWIILPQEPDPEAPVDVQAQEVRSDTYGQVDYSKQPQKESQSAKANATEASYAAYSGCAHVPPEPPKGSAEAQATQSYSSAGVYTAPPPPTEKIPYTYTAQQGEAEHVRQENTKKSESGVHGAVWFGFILLFVGICALLGTFVSGVEWWQFWPLIFVIVGLGQMIVPGKRGRRKSRFANGLMQFAFGASALFFSLGLVTLESLEPIFINLWPILVIACGLFILGGALDTPLITLIGCLCLIAFCVIGIGWFSYPGTTDLITLTLPTGHSYTYSINPWL